MLIRIKIYFIVQSRKKAAELHREVFHRSTYAWVNLVKAMCGVGVFALPSAFQQSGLWLVLNDFHKTRDPNHRCSSLRRILQIFIFERFLLIVKLRHATPTAREKIADLK
ncbi:hypothetical protein DICVIV_05539 [Dictyocaulus viviparus]|uniref:Uncharacterized protein n=1 Tax=Dictyocaulus viviparus TaxID=29172 RepID=A0A0D8XUT0_DICVI|nr:hypothetical protein DICVIV_05539 [Dictyocaulus viviparus]